MEKRSKKHKLKTRENLAEQLDEALVDLLLGQGHAALHQEESDLGVIAGQTVLNQKIRQLFGTVADTINCSAGTKSNVQTRLLSVAVSDNENLPKI